MEISIHLCVFLYTFVWTFSIVWVTSKTIQRRKTRELNRGAEKRDCRNKISWFRQRDLTNLLCISSVSFNPCCFNLSGTTGFSQNKPSPPHPHQTILTSMKVYVTWSTFKTPHLEPFCIHIFHVFCMHASLLTFSCTFQNEYDAENCVVHSSCKIFMCPVEIRYFAT